MGIKNFFFDGSHPFAYYALIFFVVIPLIMIRGFKKNRQLQSYDLENKFSILKPGEKVKKICLATYEVETENGFQTALLGEKDQGEMMDFSITTQNRLWVGFRNRTVPPLEIRPEEIQQIELNEGQILGGQAIGKLILSGKHYLKFKMLPSNMKELRGWLKKQEGFKMKLSN